MAAAAAPAPAASWVGTMQRLLLDLQPNTVDEAAVIIAGADLSVQQRAESLAAELYGAATSSEDKAEAVAQLLSQVLALDPGGTGRQLRRLLLTRCEKAFELIPPPGAGMSQGYKHKMGAMAFVAALFNASVIPPSVMHSCLAELLSGDKASHLHDLECLHFLLSAAGRCLEQASQDSAAKVAVYCTTIRKLAGRGSLHKDASLAAKLQELCAKQAAGWPQEVVPEPSPPKAAEAAAAPPPCEANHPPAATETAAGAADEAAAALASQLSLATLHPTPALNNGSGVLPPRPEGDNLSSPASTVSRDVPTVAFPTQATPPPLPSQLLPKVWQPLPKPAPLTDEWDYLATDGVSVYGPFSMEQLQFWVAQGHMTPDIMVKQHSSLSNQLSWHDLRTAAHAFATGSRLPDMAPLPAALAPAMAPPDTAPPAMPPVAPPSVPQPTQKSLHSPLIPTHTPAAITATTPPTAPPLSSFGVQDSWEDLPVPCLPSIPLFRPVAAPMAAPPAKVAAHRAAKMQIAAEPALQQAGTRLASLITAPEVPSEAAWATVAASRPSAAAAAAVRPSAVALAAACKPQPPQQRQQLKGAAMSRSYSGGGGTPRAGNGRKKSVGYEDDKEWLVRNTRGKVSGPFTGQELLRMLHDDTLAEDSMIKKSDWKAYKPLEEVEGVILEMFSTKSHGNGGGGSSGAGALPARHSSDLENRAARQDSQWAARSVDDTESAESKIKPHTSFSTECNAHILTHSRSSTRPQPAEPAPPPPLTLLVAPQSPAVHQPVASPAAAAAPGPHPLPIAAGAAIAPFPRLPGAPADAGEAPPGTPHLALPAPIQPQQQHQQQGWAPVAMSPVPTPGGLSTPGAHYAADMPAAVTPPSARYTPGLPAVESGLLAGFTPSPAYGGHCSSDSEPTALPGSCYPMQGHSPLAGQHVAQHLEAPAAGGAQVSDAPKPAFAAYAAAAAASSSQL